MNFITKLSLVLNLTFGTFAWWQYHSAHVEAEAWLKKQISKAEAQAASSCDEIRNCASMWKIAYDIKDVVLPNVSTQSTQSFADDSIIGSNPLKTNQSDGILENDTTHHESKVAEHQSEGDVNVNSHHDSKSKLPRWAEDINRRIENEKIWGGDIEIDSMESSENLLVLSGGGCKLGIQVAENKYRVDIGSMRR